VTWASEERLLADMAGWEPLPDQSDPRWDALTPEGDRLWAESERVIAAADASGEHGWLRVAVKVFEHASDWDLHGGMQSIRHGPEKAYMGVPDGIATFARELEPLTRHHRAGTRLWTVWELGILRELTSLPFLVDRLHDEHPAVAREAVRSIQMLAQDHAAAAALLPELPSD
jgi:hypothetical protein